MPKGPVLYEAMYIVDASLDDTALAGIVQTLEDHVKGLGAEVVATREFGRRRLAYEIDGHTSGTYMIMYFNSHGSVVDELVHEMRLIDGIVRGIVVVANPKAIFDPQAKAEAPAAAAEPDMALAEAATPEVSVGEAVAEPEGAAAVEAEEAAPAEESAPVEEAPEAAEEAPAEAAPEAAEGEPEAAAEASEEEA